MFVLLRSVSIYRLGSDVDNFVRRLIKNSWLAEGLSENSTPSFVNNASVESRVSSKMSSGISVKVGEDV